MKQVINFKGNALPIAQRFVSPYRKKGYDLVCENLCNDIAEGMAAYMEEIVRNKGRESIVSKCFVGIMHDYITTALGLSNNEYFRDLICGEFDGIMRSFVYQSLIYSGIKSRNYNGYFRK